MWRSDEPMPTSEHNFLSGLSLYDLNIILMDRKYIIIYLNKRPLTFSYLKKKNESADEINIDDGKFSIESVSISFTS